MAPIPELNDPVVAAYAERAADYDLWLRGRVQHDADRKLIVRWANACRGRIVDVGCGPGHWTALLHERGLAVAGLDPVPEFIERARRRHPAVDYRLGGVDDLPADALAGVLAWYSLIHLPPAELPPALRVIRRSLQPGGQLLLGFFDGDRVASFDHAVATAYYWPVAELTRWLESAGFRVLEVQQRLDPGARRHGAVWAAA